MATGIETLISTDSQVYKDYDRFSQHFGSSVIVVLVTGDDIAQLLQPDNVRAMETVESQMGGNTINTEQIRDSQVSKEGWVCRGNSC